MSTKQDQSKKADIGLAAIAQAQAADGGGINAATGLSPVVATSAIPNGAGPGVSIAHVGPLTPKFSGRFRITVTGATGANQNASIQGVTPGIAHSGSAIVDGTTTLATDVTLPEVLTGGGGIGVTAGPSAPVTAQYVDTNGVVGTPIYFAVTLFQSVAGAFAVALNGIQINAVEVP